MMSRLVTLTWVFLFILKLRFPSNIPFTHIIRSRYHEVALTLYRLVERLDYKIKKIKLDLEFLNKCKVHGIIPKFLNFTLYKSKVTRTLTYKSFQFKLLNYEISEKNKLLKKHSEDYDHALLNFHKTFSYIDGKCLLTRLIRSNDTKIKTASAIQSKKLTSLGISSEHKVNQDKVVINLSKRKSTAPEKEI